MMGWSREMVDSLIKGQLFDKDTFLVESSIWSSFLLKNKDDMNLIKTISKTSPDQGLSF